LCFQSPPGMGGPFPSTSQLAGGEEEEEGLAPGCQAAKSPGGTQGFNKRIPGSTPAFGSLFGAKLQILMTFLTQKAVNPYPSTPRGASVGRGSSCQTPPKPLTRLPVRTGSQKQDLGRFVCFLVHVCGEVGALKCVRAAADFSSGGSETGRTEASQRGGEGCGYHRMPRKKKEIEK